MKTNFLAAAAFVLLAIAATWPLVLHMSNYTVDKVDGLLITWILNWNIFHPFNFNTNIFFPYANTLAFSDFQFPLALLSAPLVLLSKEPLVAYNFSILLGLALTGFSVYQFVKYLTGDSKAGLLAGIIFSFCPLRFGYLAHPQLLNFWPVVYATMFLWQKRFKLFILFFVVAATTTPLFMYFLMFISLMGPISLMRKLGLIGLAGLATVPFLWHYWEVSRTFNYVRPITDAIHNSLQFPDLLNLRPGGTKAFLGFGAAVFLTWGLWGPTTLSLRGVKIWVMMAIGSFVMALGPALHIFTNTIHVGPIPAVPLPYSLFYYLVPGFSGMRTPSRWIILAAFAGTIAAAIGLKSKITNRILVLLVILVLLEVPWGTKFYEVPTARDFPPEQIWLKNNYSGAPIVYFPIFGWWDRESREPLREYFSTISWRPMFNGFSGFSPKEWENSVLRLQKEFPSPGSISFLKEKGVKLVIIDRGHPGDQGYPGLRYVTGFEKAVIYEIL